METAEVLRRAKALIPDEAHWTSACVNSHVGYGRHDARIYCAVGAIMASTGREPAALPEGDALPALEALASAAGIDRSHIEDWNDYEARGHAGVIAAFDKAIANAEANANG